MTDMTELKKATDAKLKHYKSYLKYAAQEAELLGVKEERLIGYYAVFNEYEEDEFINDIGKINIDNDDFLFAEHCIREKFAILIGLNTDEIYDRIKFGSIYVDKFELSDVVKKLIEMWDNPFALAASIGTNCVHIAPINEGLFITDMSKDTLIDKNVIFDNVQSWKCYDVCRNGRVRRYVRDSIDISMGYSVRIINHEVEPLDKDINGKIYLFKITEGDEVVYKVGRTMRKLNTRLSEHKRKQSHTLIHNKNTGKHITVESNIIGKFNEHFKLVKGREWFAGDEQLMIKIIDDNVVDTEPVNTR